ncbi:HesA/MoeB/ThiF family protein [Daejeonella sp.]|uniref:HesA/MoeB/ThiF family protein n=1 Tax=Daejeonella sp. TaxID=2805397 RepID=UPI0030BAE884
MAYKKGNPRYQRQTSLTEIGETGQEKLANAKVLVVGAGGLGCPALLYLAGAGIGTIGIVDHDAVSLSNLHRQVLYSSDDIGLSKVLRAADILTALNPEIDIISYNEMLNPQNTHSIISQYDFVVDGTDNFASRYMINDACVLSGKTLIYGAISRFEGQVAVFNHETGDGSAKTNYRDLFPNPPAENEILNCEEAGVIGVLPGIIGTMMANEVIKLVTGVGLPLVNRLMTYNSLTNQIYELQIQPREDTRSLIPESVNTFRQTDYDWSCSNHSANQIDMNLFKQMMKDPTVSFIDVREINETPIVEGFNYSKLPLSTFESSINGITAENVVLFCQSGKRSLSAARMLTERYGNSKKVYSLRGGIASWNNSRED